MPTHACGDPSYAAIDWQRPWLAPWRVQGEAAAGVAVRHGTLAALQTLTASPVRFVPQAELPAGVAYESHIHASACCPVREGLHDFFNGLCWHHFPRSKLQLNRLQAAAIQAQGGVQRRGALRDAITLLDENGALLLAPPAALAQLWPALLQHDWRHALVSLRPLWQQVQVVVFGHALLEKLVLPRPGLTAHLLALPLPAAQLAQAGHSTLALDALLAPRLQATHLASKPFTPLPVLGVPGWWAANADVCFYDDATVFRPARAQKRPVAQPLA
jgi:hypothetical protein